MLKMQQMKKKISDEKKKPKIDLLANTFLSERDPESEASQQRSEMIPIRIQCQVFT